ncbi:DUF6895 family protein [Micromonospora carbonacea]|uniref:DUF6895 domain-containing protein n=1 Tax=Micromonospora carbonacea TaxID=47853 RepID=A0A7H8XL50_9ACTN|nr:hypothetical protein [Micromonospora carbonacea]MBB5825964.1 hypothetical protein [Micromonospora carbonacea]QLD25554.1 hypothetical protein HXZ27_16170 [Micromonospora carbonacea]
MVEATPTAVDVADQDAAAADEAARRGMRRLSEGSRAWMSAVPTQFLAPDFGGLPVTPRAKACLELALLRRLWARVGPGDPALARVTSAVDAIWADPSFPGQIAAEPRYARQYGLAYAALAPAGAGLDQATLERIAPAGHFTPYSRSSYLRLEMRFYADLAGLDHDIESYPVLYQGCELPRFAEAPTDIEAAYRVTHTLFHMTDFGAHAPQITEAERRHALTLVDRMTTHFIAVEHWDLTAELLLSQHCLGQDPTLTGSGAAGVRALLAVQTADGRIPARFAAQRIPETSPPVDLFRRAFHTTLVTAFASMISLADA